MVAGTPAGTIGRIVATFTGVAIAVSLTTACFSETTLSCDEQEALAGELANDQVFDRVSVPAKTSDKYTSHPCSENSGGSLVTAGERYTLQQPLSVDDLSTLAAKAVEPTRWRQTATIRPTDRGSGKAALLCFESSAGTQPQYLKLTSTHSGPFFLYVEVSQAENAVQMCPTAG
jgi:hypothetical protein